MNNESYTLALIILASMLLYFGLYLILGAIPKKLKGSAYQTARRYMGAAFLVIVASVGFYFTLDLDDQQIKYRVMLNLSSYFVASKLFAASFFTLLGVKVTTRNPKLIVSHILSILYPIALTSCALLINDIDLNELIAKIAAMLLLISIIIEVVVFFRLYRRFISQGSLYYGKGAYTYLRWMLKSVYFIIAAGVVCGFFALYSSVLSKFVLFLFLSYFVGTCIYIFNSFLRFVTAYGEMQEKSHHSETLPTVDISKTPLSSETYRYLNEQIFKWTQKKEYCKAGLTILSTASKLGTNRLYLSQFINLTYGCSFRIWISNLRITEAKEIMTREPYTKITMVAQRVGFTSLTSFTHAFKNIENTSPANGSRDSGRG